MLSTLVLTQNQISELAELEALKGMRKLIHLSLLENPVQSKEVGPMTVLYRTMLTAQNYRYYVLYLTPSLRFLDFQKVKDSERTKAEELFGTHDAPSELTRTILASRANGAFGGAPVLTNGADKFTNHNWSPAERMRYDTLIRNVKSLAEITRLEKMRAEGRVPPGIGDSEVMDET